MKKDPQFFQQSGDQEPPAESVAEKIELPGHYEIQVQDSNGWIGHAVVDIPADSATSLAVNYKIVYADLAHAHLANQYKILTNINNRFKSYNASRSHDPRQSVWQIKRTDEAKQNIEALNHKVYEIIQRASELQKSCPDLVMQAGNNPPRGLGYADPQKRFSEYTFYVIPIENVVAKLKIDFSTKRERYGGSGYDEDDKWVSARSGELKAAYVIPDFIGAHSVLDTSGWLNVTDDNSDGVRKLNDYCAQFDFATGKMPDYFRGKLAAFRERYVQQYEKMMPVFREYEDVVARLRKYFVSTAPLDVTVVFAPPGFDTEQIPLTELENRQNEMQSWLSFENDRSVFENQLKNSERRVLGDWREPTHGQYGLSDEYAKKIRSQISDLQRFYERRSDLLDLISAHALLLELLDTFKKIIRGEHAGAQVSVANKDIDIQPGRLGDELVTKPRAHSASLSFGRDYVPEKEQVKPRPVNYDAITEQEKDIMISQADLLMDWADLMKKISQTAEHKTAINAALRKRLENLSFSIMSVQNGLQKNNLSASLRDRIKECERLTRDLLDDLAKIFGYPSQAYERLGLAEQKASTEIETIGDFNQENRAALHNILLQMSFAGEADVEQAIIEAIG